MPTDQLAIPTEAAGEANATSPHLTGIVNAEPFSAARAPLAETMFERILYDHIARRIRMERTGGIRASATNTGASRPAPFTVALALTSRLTIGSTPAGVRESM